MTPDDGPNYAEQQAAAIEAEVAKAIVAKDFDLAARLAAGHPSPAKHEELNRRIFNARTGDGVERVVDADSRPGTDLAGDELPPPSKMFEIRRKAAKLTSFNPRAEKNGDGTRPAADLRFVANLDASLLDRLDKSLRGWLFAKAGKGADLADGVHDAPALRQPRIAQDFAWIVRYIGYELRIHDLGLDASRDLILRDCALNKITLSPQEGGTVIVKFRIQFHPTEAQAGKLSTLIQSQVDVSLLAPEGAEEEEDDEPGDDED